MPGSDNDSESSSLLEWLGLIGQDDSVDDDSAYLDDEESADDEGFVQVSPPRSVITEFGSETDTSAPDEEEEAQTPELTWRCESPPILEPPQPPSQLVFADGSEGRLAFPPHGQRPESRTNPEQGDAPVQPLVDYELGSEDMALQRALLLSYEGVGRRTPCSPPHAAPPMGPDAYLPHQEGIDSPWATPSPELPAQAYLRMHPLVLRILSTYLDLVSQLALRATCSVFRDFVDSVLGQHLVISNSRHGAGWLRVTTKHQRPVWSFPLGPWVRNCSTQVTRSGASGRGRLDAAAKRLLAQALIVDINADDPTTVLDLLRDSLHRVDTLRLSSPKILARGAILPATTAVIFSPPEPQRQRSHPGCHLPESVKSAVINIVVDQRHEYSPIPFWAPIRDVSEITVILSLAQPVPRAMREIILKPVSFLLDPLGTLIADRVPTAEVIVVLPEDIPGRWFAIDSFPEGVPFNMFAMSTQQRLSRSGRENIIARILSEVKSCLPHLYMALGRPDISFVGGSSLSVGVRGGSFPTIQECEAAVMSKTTRVWFLTPQGYRKKVGEETFALHTSGGSLCDRE